MQAVESQGSYRPPGATTPQAEPLARLLLQWGVAPPAAPASIAAQLGGFLGWADAILLSQALGAPAAGGSQPDPDARAWADAALDRVQVDLRAAFADPELAAESAEPLPDKPTPLADLLAPYRLHHAQQQRGIAARVASLRERLRARLAGGATRLAQLAALDAVFDRALGAHERTLLAALPTVLTRRAETHAAADPRRWRERFWADLQRALQAELDLRLQPVLGLIDALHAEPACAAT